MASSVTASSAVAPRSRATAAGAGPAPVNAPSVYAERRARLAQQLRAAGGGVALIANAPERTRSHDVEHPYRHDSSFHYLTGFDEPQAWLALHASGATALLCRAKDPGLEIWHGKRLGIADAPAVLGVDAAFDIESLDAVMFEQLKNEPAVWVPFGAAGALVSRAEAWLVTLRSHARNGVEAPGALRDLAPLLAEMRLVKDATELATMRRAAQISADGHARTMRFCGARFRAEPNGVVREYELEAELLHEFRRRGAQSPAYPAVVAAGANACILHYAASDAALRAGELCLIDAGCELDGYASDITRTFPATGRFSAPQRELYEIVLAAQQAAIDVTRPGARQRDAHHAAVRVLVQGMLDSGLLERQRVGDVDAVLEGTAYHQFYMHGTGHWLGRDVHDVGEYLSLAEEPVAQIGHLGRPAVIKPSRVLQPGLVVTIEPGLYVRPAEGVPERFWNIGIRIEDDAVVTENGCELISRGVPVAVAEIEALMRGAA